MKTIIFDGEKEARKREERLGEKIRAGKNPPLKLVVIVFTEDRAGQIYARLKGEAAIRVGIEFERVDHSINDDLILMAEEIDRFCSQPEVTGVMIQKPSKKVFGKKGFSEWWHKLTALIDPKKDVDCLTLVNLNKVYEGKWLILPATVKAIVEIVEISCRGEARLVLINKRVVVIGRSEIVGRPLAAVLAQKGLEVDLLGSKTVDLADKVRSAEVVVSATGIKHLIKGEWIKPGAVVIDVGSPNPEIDFELAKTRAGFITPVPFGVGPMTVVSLLENLTDLI